jgi:hypothetical protein
MAGKDKDAEKTVKAASKELSVVYKSWVQQIKSKDAAQISALLGQSDVDDDVFLFAGGAVSALARGIGFKEDDARLAVLRLVGDGILCRRFACETDDDVAAPPAVCTRRCRTFLEACVANGAGLAGAETLLACVTESSAQHQLHGLRALRAVTAAMLSVPPTSPLFGAFVRDCLLHGMLSRSPAGTNTS